MVETCCVVTDQQTCCEERQLILKDGESYNLDRKQEGFEEQQNS